MSKTNTNVYRSVAGYCRLVGTDKWLLASFWWTTKPVIPYLVGRRSGLFGKKKSKVHSSDELNKKIALEFSKK